MKVAILGNGKSSLHLKTFFNSLGVEPNIFGFDIVARVHKRFLGQDISNDRFKDLFRIVTSTQNIISTKELENYSQKDKDYLNAPIENFIDVDLVIDTSKENPKFYGAGNDGVRALNEELAGKESGLITYMKTNDHESLLVGKIEYLEDIVDSNQDGTVILKEGPAVLKDYPNLNSLFEKRLKEYNEREAQFKIEKETWENLEIYEQRKILPPKRPAFDLGFYFESVIQSIDYLSNQNDLYITIESNPLEKDSILKTLKTKNLAIFSGHEHSYSHIKGLHIDSQGRSEEKGFLFFPVEEASDSIESELNLLRSEIDKLFSPK